MKLKMTAELHAEHHQITIRRYLTPQNRGRNTNPPPLQRRRGSAPEVYILGVFNDKIHSKIETTGYTF